MNEGIRANRSIFGSAGSLAKTEGSEETTEWKKNPQRAKRGTRKIKKLSNKMDNSLLAVRFINHKYIVVERKFFMKKRFISMLLSLMMVLSLVPVSALAAEFGDVWGSDYDNTTTFSISTKEELIAFASMVNAENDAKDFRGKTVVLEDDIDLNGIAWIPIGCDKNNTNARTYDGKPFAGTFDGKGHTISNLSIEQPENDFLGLFGGVDGAVIKNLKINNCSINGQAGQEFFASNGEGYNQNSTIADAPGLIAYVSTGGATINNISIDQIDIFSDRACGTLIGWVSGRIDISDIIVENANVMSSGDRAGGLIGYFGGSSSYDASINNCSVQGNVRLSHPKASSAIAAGLVGRVDLQSSNTLTITQTSVDVNVTTGEIRGDWAENGMGAGMIGRIANGKVIFKNSSFSGNIDVKRNQDMSPGLGCAYGFAEVQTNGSLDISNCKIEDTTISGTNIYSFASQNVTVENSFIKAKMIVADKKYIVNSLDEAITQNMYFPYSPKTGTLLPVDTPRSGYSFAWKDGEENIYTNFDGVIENTNTIKPVWTPNTYTITFDGNEATSGTMSDITGVKYDEIQILPANTFTKTDMNFAGWDTDSSADEVVYANGTQVKNLTDVKDGTVTLYAVWTTKDVLNPDMTPQTKTYNGETQGFTLDGGYTITYKQNGVDATPKDAGTYDVVISKAESNDNAAFQTTISDGLTITPATLTITADNKTIYVGQALPAYTYTVTGWQGSDSTLTPEPTMACEADGKTAGTYNITASGAKASANYTITYVDGTLTVYAYSGGGSSSSNSSEKPAASVTPIPDPEVPKGEAGAGITKPATTALTMKMKINDKVITANGKNFTCDVAPIIVGDRTMVPVRVIMETLGAKVDWNEATRTVTITMGDKVMSMVIDQEIPGYGTAPFIQNDRTYVPIRYFMEKAGADVKWIAETGEIVITK